MKQRLSVCILLILLLIQALPMGVSASESTSYTYTQSVNGEWIRTQDAYMPGSVFLNDGTLNMPEDLFVSGDTLYIADTGNSRLLAYHIPEGSYQVLGEGIFASPCGIFVNDEAIFVADKGAEAVFKLDKTGKLLMTLGRPDSYLFSAQSRYVPKNVCVTSQGVIFVCGEGAYEGLMQFDEQGVFQGYYAPNTTELTWMERIEELILSEEQLEKLLTRIPEPIYNMDISDRDLVYSVTQSEGGSWSAKASNQNAVKYHNMAGIDILSKGRIEDEYNFTDIAAYKDGLSLAVTSSGLIYEYDDAGNVVFSFGGRASSERIGHFTYACAIDVDDNNAIYVLDRERGYVQTFFATGFAVSTHEAIRKLSDGSYAESQATWEELLRLNGMSLIAHRGYGKVLYQQQRFSEAAEEFHIVGDTASYSDCRWELRNLWFRRYLPYFFGGLAVLLAALYIRRLLIRRGRIRPGRLSHLPPVRFMKRQGSYAFGMLRHPIDECYYIKRGLHGSVASATVLWGLAFAVYLFDMLGRCFTFSLLNPEKTYPLSVVALFVIPAALWVFGNRMVSAINDGEGRLGSIYVSTAYSLMPYILLGSLTVIATYVFTLNEAVVIDLLWTAAIGWSAALIGLSVKEIHNYSLRETLKLILLTLFFMVLAVVVAVIIYLIVLQFFDFFRDLINEVTWNV